MTLSLVVGGHDLSDDLLWWKTEAEERNPAAIASFIFLNIHGEWLGDFNPADAVTLTIDGTTIFNGYFDDSVPYIDKEYPDLDLMELRAIDYGFDLQRLSISKEYAASKDDDLVDDALSTAGSEINYTSPGTGVVTAYIFRDTYLGDGLRDVAEDRGRCFYVDGSKALHWFTENAPSEYLDGSEGRPDVHLKLVSEDPTNNIIDFRRGESHGSKLFNSVKLQAGPLQDHLTELNASDWTAGAGCSVSNSITTVLTDYIVGRGGIKISRPDTGELEVTLTFYDSINGSHVAATKDLSKNDTGVYLVQANYTPSSSKYRTCRVRFCDSSDNWIEFRRNIRLLAESPLDNRTDDLPNNLWCRVNFPYGSQTTISSLVGANEQWAYVGAAVSFDWTQVKSIKFTTYTGFGTVGAGGGYFIIDGLTIPGIEVTSVYENAASIAAYRKRMYTKVRRDVLSQVELDAVCAALGPKLKDPLETLMLKCIGNVNTRYVSQTLDVYAPPKGLDSYVEYRITKLIHRGWSKRYREDPRFSHVTEYELVNTDASWDAMRREWTANPFSQLMRELVRSKYWDNRRGVPTIPYATLAQLAAKTQIVTAFPADPEDGDIVYHTGWGGIFRYDATLECWVQLDYDLLNDTDLSVDSNATGLSNSAASTGLSNSAAATGLSNSAAATGLANEATGNHSHNLSNSAGYIVTSYSTLYAASESGGSPTTAFYAPTAVEFEYIAWGAAVIAGGGHNHPHGTDSHETGHGADSHNTGHGADSHNTGHGSDSHPHTDTDPSHDHTVVVCGEPP